MPTLAPLLVFVWLFLLAVPAAAQGTDSAPSQAVLTAGDSVRIVVWRKPEFSGDFVVAPNGTVTHPLFRSVQIGGVPFATAEANVRRFLQRFEENPEFVMEPLVSVSVSGEVGRAGVFAVRPETTVGEAVARAGGARENGAPNKTRVMRTDASGSLQQFDVDVTSNQSLMAIRSGDQIIVPRRRSFFRDILVPALGIIGSVASLGLLIDRYSRRD